MFGEFDSGSERTLAAWIRHASRTDVAIHQWRKGEERVGDLPSSWEQLRETGINTEYDCETAWFCTESSNALEEELASHQLVGEVTAHQGDDGQLV